MFRLIPMFIFFAFALSSQVAHACSCFCEYGHKVSDYMKSHEVFWGLPISSRFDRKNETVVTEIEVLESFGRIKKKTVQVFSAPDDGATCGITVPLAVPKLINAYGVSTGSLNMNSCICEIPATPLLKYLNTGEDTYIPKIDKCFDKDMNPKKSDYCKIWNSSTDDVMLVWKTKLDYIIKLRNEAKAEK